MFLALQFLSFWNWRDSTYQLWRSETARPHHMYGQASCFWVWMCCRHLSWAAIAHCISSSSNRGTALKCTDPPIHSAKASTMCEHMARAASFVRPQCPCLSWKNRYANSGLSTCMCSSSLKARSLFSTCCTMPPFHEKASGHGLLGHSTIITSSWIMNSSLGCGGSVTVDSATVRHPSNLGQ